MSYGLKIWNASGQLRLDVTDRMPRHVAQFSGNRYANSVVDNQTGINNYLRYAGDPTLIPVNRTFKFNITHTGIVNDGSWWAVITSVSGLFTGNDAGDGHHFKSSFPPDYLSAYCTIQTDRIVLSVTTLITNFMSDAQLFQSTCSYKIDLYRT